MTRLKARILRWGQITSPIDLLTAVRRVYRPDLYREAAGDLGISAPAVDLKSEGAHLSEWFLGGSAGPIRMGSDRFFDGREFHPTEAISYLVHSEIAAPVVSFDALAALNP